MNNLLMWTPLGPDDTLEEVLATRLNAVTVAYHRRADGADGRVYVVGRPHSENGQWRVALKVDGDNTVTIRSFPSESEATQQAEDWERHERSAD